MASSSSGWTTNGAEGAFIPAWDDIRQSDNNNLLGLFKGGIYAHVVLGTGLSNGQSIIDPVDLTAMRCWGCGCTVRAPAARSGSSW